MSPDDVRQAILGELVRLRSFLLRREGVTYVGPLHELSAGCEDDRAARLLQRETGGQVPVFVTGQIRAQPVQACTALVKHRGVIAYERTMKG